MLLPQTFQGYEVKNAVLWIVRLEWVYLYSQNAFEKLQYFKINVRNQRKQESEENKIVV